MAAGGLTMARLLTNGYGQGIGNRPTIRVQAHLDRLSIQPRFERPVANGLDATIKLNIASVTAIPNLFRIRGPADILRLVIASVVNAVETMRGRRRWTNVRQKRLKRLAPAQAYLNSASTIAPKIFHAGVCTTADHCVPRAPFLRAPGLYAMTMLIHGVLLAGHPYRRDLGMKTSATLRRAGAKRVPQYWSLSPTVAPTKPPRWSGRSPWRSNGTAQDKPAPNAFSSQINQLCHEVLSLWHNGYASSIAQISGGVL